MVFLGCNGSKVRPKERVMCDLVASYQKISLCHESALGSWQK